MKVFIVKDYKAILSIVLNIEEAVKIIKEDMYLYYISESPSQDTNKLKDEINAIIINNSVYYSSANTEFSLHTDLFDYNVYCKELDEILSEYINMSEQLKKYRDKEMVDHWKEMKLSERKWL